MMNFLILSGYAGEALLLDGGGKLLLHMLFLQALSVMVVTIFVFMYPQELLIEGAPPFIKKLLISKKKLKK